jgi:anti-sigma regulatory factor (Ser/Thr protein kinase)
MPSRETAKTGAMRNPQPASLELRLQARPEFAVLLAVTEAFANAVEHPDDPRSHVVDVEGTIGDQAVTVSIRDYGTWQGEDTKKEEGGMGLVMMEELMDAVRVECFQDGTTVTMQRRLALR